MNKFEKIVAALLLVVAVELGAVVYMAARFINGVTIELFEEEKR